MAQFARNPMPTLAFLQKKYPLVYCGHSWAKEWKK
jgi:hypothetical protein